MLKRGGPSYAIGFAAILLLSVVVWLGLCLLYNRETLILESRSPDLPWKVRVVTRYREFHKLPLGEELVDVVAEFVQDGSRERWELALMNYTTTKAAARRFDAASWEGEKLQLYHNGWLSMIIDVSQRKIVKFFP